MRIPLTLLSLFSSTTLFTTNIVQNGNFATGDFTGWTLFGDDSQFGVTTFDGSHAADLFTSGLDVGFIEQVLPTTTGATYAVNFSLGWSGILTPDFVFSFSIGGTNLLTQTTPLPMQGILFPFSYTYTAVSSSDAIDALVNESAPSWFLTNVSVVLTTPPPPPPPPPTIKNGSTPQAVVFSSS